MSKKSILIAEGKESLFNIIKQFLGDDYDCICATTAEKALEAIDKVDGAVVSLNIEENKRETNIISDLKAKKDVPVLILTTQNNSQIRINSLKAGADDIMVKPFNPEELYLRVKRLMK